MFAGLAAGSYVVAEALPPNWVQTAPTVATECISVDNAGNPAADTSGGAAITPDGRFVAFEAYSANLVPNDTNEHGRTFLCSTGRAGPWNGSALTALARRATSRVMARRSAQMDGSWLSTPSPPTWFPETQMTGKTRSCSIDRRGRRSA